MIGPTRGLTARTRLTLWYSVLLAGSMLALGSLGLWLTGRVLHASADELLRTRTAALLTEIDFERGRLVVELATDPDEETAALMAGLDLVRVWDRQRRLVFHQDAAPRAPLLDPALLDALLNGQRPFAFQTVGVPTGEALRTYAVPVRDNERVVGVVEVGRSLGDVEMALGTLRAFGIAGLFVATALGWAGGWFLAGRALAPVDRITRAAEQLGADDLSRRLGLVLPDDELGRLARAFDGMLSRLERAFQRQRQFTADASHELRTPLTVIRSQAEVALSRTRDPAYYARVLASICEESERLERLAESLLLLARADAGQPPTLSPIDLEDLVIEAGARATLRARDRAVQVTVAVEPTGLVRGDADWMTRLLTNLLDNAVRHTPAGGRVALSLGAEDGCAVLRVADTGEGIPPEHLPHIFERFYRVDRARARASGGAGLGLAICEWVARLHGGHLTVASTPGQGTTFTLRLPTLVEPAPTPASQPAPMPAT